MKILHINQHDIEGGAAKAAYRLHAGLIKAGHESRLLVDHQRVSEKEIDSIANGQPWWPIVSKSIHLTERLLSLQYLIPRPNQIETHLWTKQADVIHLHNIHGSYFSLNQLIQLSSQKPVVWTFHDMWPLTGHCSYSYECNRWKTGCGECPILKDYPPLLCDTTALHWHVKKKIYQKCHIELAVPSGWLYQIAKESPLLGQFPMSIIPYGLDTDVFRPIEQAKARQMLKLPLDMPLIAFGAVELDDPRKGGKYFIEAIQKLQQEAQHRFGVIIFGGGFYSDKLLDAKVWHFGKVKNEDELAQIYSAANIFVNTSIADNLPNTIIESTACGTPVVTFKTGGVSDIVDHMKTGYLTDPKEVSQLADGIKAFLTDPEFQKKVSTECRKKALNQFSSTLHAERYSRIYLRAIQSFKTENNRQNTGM